mmetsp:Transcript_1447/g.2418  ORF Transcript_1447/g.2418 Transcript_1447/m.2418 type:complete len:491 (+) Transcript_1447:77-1549(+)
MVKRQFTILLKRSSEGVRWRPLCFGRLSLASDSLMQYATRSQQSKSIHVGRQAPSLGDASRVLASKSRDGSRRYMVAGWKQLDFQQQNELLPNTQHISRFPYSTKVREDSEKKEEKGTIVPNSTPKLSENPDEKSEQSNPLSSVVASSSEAISSVKQSWKSIADPVTAQYVRVHSEWDKFAKSRFGRLLRADKPTGTALLFLPGAMAISLAATPGHLPSIGMMAAFGLGSFLLRGAGCIINDLVDRDIDSKVERTKTRPLVTGEVSEAEAFTAIGGLVALAAPIALAMNEFSLGLAVAALIPMSLYPLAKRTVAVPQAVLGLTFNWGALLGYSAITGGLDLAALSLFASCWCWTMMYDTIYAFQDKDDDEKLKVQSAALYFSKMAKQTEGVVTENQNAVQSSPLLEDSNLAKKYLVGFSVGQTAFMALTGILTHQAWPFYAGVAAIATHGWQQIYLTDLNNRDSCLKAFQSNSHLGSLMVTATILSNLIR